MNETEFKKIYRWMNGAWRNRNKSTEQFVVYQQALIHMSYNHLDRVIRELEDVTDEFPTIATIKKISAEIRMQEIRNQEKKRNIASKDEIQQHRRGAAQFCKYLLEREEQGRVLKCQIKDERTISAGQAIVQWVNRLADSTTDYSRPVEKG